VWKSGKALAIKGFLQTAKMGNGWILGGMKEEKLWKPISPFHFYRSKWIFIAHFSKTGAFPHPIRGSFFVEKRRKRENFPHR